eukprot:PLAT9148.1.p1 GENE.PLAT9148.1~~PLAT9148.1.p1  ORF type:complete len:170 (+),score=34.43 PLAT9148.1:69-512(+)
MYVIRDMTDISFNRSLGFLGISSLVEVAMFFVACVVCYRRFGISLLHHAAYLLKKHMRFLLATSSILMAYTVSILFRCTCLHVVGACCALLSRCLAHFLRSQRLWPFAWLVLCSSLLFCLLVSLSRFVLLFLVITFAAWHCLGAVVV